MKQQHLSKFFILSLIAILIAWALLLVVISIQNFGGVSFAKGRTFAILSNSVFLLTTLGIFGVAIVKAKPSLIPMIFILGLWLVGFFTLGFLPYAYALFGGPSRATIQQTASENGYPEDWIDNALMGPAISAANEYTTNVYQWELLGQVKREPWTQKDQQLWESMK